MTVRADTQKAREFVLIPNLMTEGHCDELDTARYVNLPCRLKNSYNWSASRLNAAKGKSFSTNANDLCLEQAPSSPYFNAVVPLALQNHTLLGCPRSGVIMPLLVRVRLVHRPATRQDCPAMV